jgi:hypothetical protein
LFLFGYIERDFRSEYLQGNMNMARTNLLIAIFLLQAAALIAGTNDAVYLHEGFNALALPTGWNIRRISGTSASWSFIGQGSNPTVSPYAGPGQAKFNSFDAALGEQARLTSRSINLSSASDPFLSFWMYHDDEYLSSFDSLYVEVTTNDSVNGPWTPLAGFRRPRNENRWRQQIVPLFPYRGANRLFISLRGVSKYGNNVFVDEFRVADSTFHDIGTAGLIYNETQLSFATSPSPLPEHTLSRIGKGKRSEPCGLCPLVISNDAPLNIGAIVHNIGTFTENSYTIGWRINTQSQPAVAGRTIAARMGRDTLTLTWAAPVAGLHTVTAWTVLAGDSNRTNDTTRVTIQVVDTATVFYQPFNGGSFPPTGWLAINRDGGALAPWFRGADTSSFIPFEGAGFAGNNFARANGSYLDDYLISPPIPNVNTTGRVDSLIFWTRSMNNTPPAINYPDSLMVLLSTTGADTSNFVITVDYFSVPKTGWTRKAYLLSNRVPSNSTVRIAFRYLLYNVLPNGGSGDFIGIDAVQVVKKIPTSITSDVSTPLAYSLDQNYPNPFNPQTICTFSIPKSQWTTLRVYDILGREIHTLVNGVTHAGTHSVRFDASELPSGIYFATLEAGTFRKTIKMLLLQ